MVSRALILLATATLFAPRIGAQTADTVRVTVPASRAGVHFVPPRPGGRRIIIIPEPAVPAAAEDVALPASPAVQAPAPDFTNLERRLEAMERALRVEDAQVAREHRMLADSLRTVLGMLRASQARQIQTTPIGPALVPGTAGQLIESPDSLLSVEPDSVAQQAQPALPAEPVPPAPPERPLTQGAVPAPDPAVIERMMLDTGLFRAVQVVFELDSSRLLPHAYPTLDALAEVLSRNANFELNVVGHTDDRGAPDYNLDLSERRAQSVVAYLVERGVSADRLTAVGRGESEPIASNSFATGRVLNRRVEFVVR